MHYNKKGLSDLVSNVLIILLVFASIAIMGVIILNLVRISGESIENAAACKQINVKPVQCIHNVSDANFLFSTEYETGVVLKEVDTVAVFSDGTSVNQSILGAVLGNFETQSVRESRGENNYDKFYTVTKFTDKRGIDRTCVSDKVDCTLYSPSGSSSSNNGGTITPNPLPTTTVSGSGGGNSGGGSNGGSNGGGNTTVINGVCGTNLRYSCNAGTSNSTSGHNNSDYIWSCVGSGNGATTALCKLPLSTNQAFVLSQTCAIHTIANNAGCSGVDINGSAYCWNYNVATAWSNISSGTPLNASFIVPRYVNNSGVYLDGNWLQQMPQQSGEQITPGIAYQGAFSLNCLLGIPPIGNGGNNNSNFTVKNITLIYPTINQIFNASQFIRLNFTLIGFNASDVCGMYVTTSTGSIVSSNHNVCFNLRNQGVNITSPGNYYVGIETAGITPQIRAQVPITITGGITITSPINGQVVNRGQSFPVNVLYSGFNAATTTCIRSIKILNPYYGTTISSNTNSCGVLQNSPNNVETINNASGVYYIVMQTIGLNPAITSVVNVTVV